MAETTGSPRETPCATGKISDWLFAFLKWFWIAVILAFVVGVLASVVAAVVPGNFADFMKNITTWIFGNLLLVGLILVILAPLNRPPSPTIPSPTSPSARSHSWIGADPPA
jgi:hypothetical protein